MSTERISVDKIVEKAHTWRRTGVDTYIACVDSGFNEYEDYTYSRAELVTYYGDLVNAIDATLYHATHPGVRDEPDYYRGTVCLARGVEMLRQHQVKAPISYIDDNGAEHYIFNIYEFYSYNEVEDTALLVIERYSLDVSGSGTVYVNKFKEDNVTLPMSLLEEHYPNCRGRLKAALGVGLKDDMSDAAFVQYICQTDKVTASIAIEQLPTDMLPA